MRRRNFISLVGGAAAWPLATHAQQPERIRRIGLLGSTVPSGVAGRLDRFRDGLRDLGYVEGQNILIDFRWAEADYAKLPELAAELIRLKVDLLVTYGTPGTLAAKRATTTVPLVMLVSGDAIATGLITSLARPGGNVTGSTFFDPELHASALRRVGGADGYRPTDDVLLHKIGERLLAATRFLWDHSALMLRARMTLPHFFVSSAMSLPKSAGESASALPPRSASRALNLGSARPALISLLSFSTISAGVAFGAQTPNQPLAS
jgi:hypothetical protein